LCGNNSIILSLITTELEVNKLKKRERTGIVITIKLLVKRTPLKTGDDLKYCGMVSKFLPH
jgi:hypothetical protein